MINIIISLTSWLANRLNSTVSWLENRTRSSSTALKFVDLAPNDEADQAGVYSEAILFATNNAKVSNIALTGPYGSGKSSIIMSFLKKYRRPALHISLAAFVPGGDSIEGEVSAQEIERSILQKMLYGADANKLPLSRFKRIQSPGFWSIFKSLYIMLGIFSFWYVFHHREAIMAGSFFAPLAITNWLNLGIFVFAIAFLWVILHHIYVASFGLSLKSISLKNVEIKPAHDDQTSILNRHLDEIIYFFQSTDYDLVIIEDLDRFNNSDIFVTLREINSLVNANAGVKRNIRFLYALRDDMFINTDRTKFFEFIIPVIPIINTSNSIDMVLKQGSRLELDGRLNRQFLREVSRYLNDMRLIHNIFNEYAIYVANLEADKQNLLDANKLLSILIYKNVYPRDFEQLHRGEGSLMNILNHQDKLIGYGEATHRSEISEIQKRLEVAERQIPIDHKELRRIYAMALIERLPVNANSVSLDNQRWITLPQLVNDDKFEQLIVASRVYYRSAQNRTQQVDISKLQNEVDSHKSFNLRKEELESQVDDNKIESLRRINELKSKITMMRATKLNELLRLNSDRIHELFEDFGENGELARFLILEGYLDDTFYQYTSLFHSGRLSPSDNKFLIQIRAFKTPEPLFQIDNPKEVIAAMRDEDFRRSYALNVKLVDTLLSDQTSYRGQTVKFLEFVSSEFESSEDFLDAYYTSGRYVESLLLGLSNTWEGLVPTIVASPNNTSHVTQLVSYLPESILKTLATDFEELPEFVSANLPEILVSSPELAPERLKCVNFEVKDLTEIKEHSEIVRFMFEEGLYELTIENLEYVYLMILGEKDLESMRERNYTAIRQTKNATLIKRIERAFDQYLRDVLLELQGNSKEDATAILAVIRHDELDKDDIQQFLDGQESLLATLEGVPERLHEMLFNLDVIEATWANCLTFMESDGFEAASLAGYLERDTVREVILGQPIPADSDSFHLRQFLINSSVLTDKAYREYAHALPKLFQKFPEELEPTKLRILIDEEKITFTKESLDALVDNIDLQVRFVAVNIDTYLAFPEKFALDDGFREELLRTEVDNIAKIGIIQLMALGELANLPKRAALIGQTIYITDAKISNIDSGIAQTLVMNSDSIETQIALFNKYHSLLTKEEVHNVLASMPKPYSEIKTGYSTPRLKNTPKNLDLVRWLDSRNIISSWSESSFLTDDIRVNLFRR
jgi:hypothetical protein